MVVNIFTKQIRQQEDETGRGHTPNSLHGVISPRNEELPQLRDYPSAKREALFDQKLELCSHVFSFEDAASNKKEKEVKRQTLLELVDYVNTSAGQKIFTESSMPAIMNCVRANICRSLPPQTEDYDPEEDEPILEPSWPHLQVVYEFFLRFVVSSEVNAKVAKKYVDANFCYSLSRIV
jgi:serine/threonine-protein phosphatase 2A regulatory subunit B'